MIWFYKISLKETAIFFVAIFFSSLLIAQPTISSFSPLSGRVGSSVTINGTGFSSTSANNIVFFGAVKATVSAATNTTLKVVVPAGASYQPISVTNNYLTAYSPLSFSTSFSGGGGPFTTGSFAPYLNLNAGSQPAQALIADLDGDGKPDLNTDNSNYIDSLWVFRNLGSPGNISFVPVRRLPLAGSNTMMAAADLNGDGKLDLIVTSKINNSNFVSVYTNTTASGAISFDGGIQLTTGISPVSPSIGDIDGDGKPDILVANKQSNTFSIFLNTSVNGTVSFANKIDFAAPSVTSCFAITDFDGDGKPDIAVLGIESDSIIVFRNTSTRGAISMTTGPKLKVKGWPYKIIAGDLDGDGKQDLLVANDSSTDIFIYKNTSSTGNISFGPQIIAPGSGGKDFNISDLNGDGKPDIAAVIGSSAAISRNISSVGSIAFDTAVKFVMGSSSLGIAMGDLDGDGKTDVLSTNYFNNSVSALRNTFNVGSTPQITSFSPDSGGTGSTIVIKGINLTGATSVRFGSTNASSFSVVSDSLINAVVSNGASGNVYVSTPYGMDSLAGFVYKVPILAPVIRSFTPDSAKTGTTVIIYGNYFTGATSVRFGSTNASSFSVVSDSVINAVVGNGASGNVYVSTPYGMDSLAGFIYRVPIPAPVIRSFTPDSAKTGTTVTIYGNYFTGATSVRFGNANASSFSLVSDSVIKAVVGNGASGYVYVSTPYGMDSLAGFVYKVPNPAPVVSSFTPDSAKTGTTVTIYGNYFTGATSVRFGSSNASSFSVVSDSVIKAVVGNGASGYVYVGTPYGIDSLAGFIYRVPNTAPVISSFTPDSAKTGTTVTLYGNYFSGAISVRFGSSNASSFSVISDSVINAVVGNGASGSIYVATVYGTDSLPGFTYVQTTPSPHLISFSPTSANAGTTVTIIGSNFSGTTALSFGGTPASSYLVLSDSVIKAIVGTASSSGAVRVTTAFGSDSLNGFVFLNGLTVFPNPATNSLTVNFPYSSVASELALFNMTGQRVWSLNINLNSSSVTMNLTGIQPGIYIVSWTDGSKALKRTVMIR